MPEAPAHRFRAGDTVIRTKTMGVLPQRLQMAAARFNHVCEDCRSIIHKGEIHASRPWTHVCAKCVTIDRAIS